MRKRPYRLWRKSEIAFMRRQAGKMPRKNIARQLGRTAPAVAQQASVLGISLRVAAVNYKH